MVFTKHLENVLKSVELPHPVSDLTHLRALFNRKGTYFEILIANFSKYEYPAGLIKVLQWPMDSKTKSRCCLGMLKINNLRRSSFRVIELGSYGPERECLNNNH